ncbi:hypothetical protein D3C85_971490 [compost metagenome]
MGLFGCGAGDLVVPAVFFAVARDCTDRVATVEPAEAGFAPLDGDFITGNESAPMDVSAQIEERRATCLAPLARQRLAGFGVEQEWNGGMREVVVALLAAHGRTADHLRHGIGLMQRLHANEAHDVFAPVLGGYYTLGTAGGGDIGVGMEHAFETALQPGLGHVVQQIPGATDVHALALEASGDVIEERSEVLWHLGLLLVENFLFGQQFGRHHQAIEGAIGMRCAKPGAKAQYVAGQGRWISRVEMRQVGQQHPHQCAHATQMAQVALAVVRVSGMQLRVRCIRSGHVPGIELSHFRGFFELSRTAGQE